MTVFTDDRMKHCPLRKKQPLYCEGAKNGSIQNNKILQTEEVYGIDRK